MKRIIGLLSVFCGVAIGSGIATAVDIQTAPVEQEIPSSPEMNKQNFNIGPKDSGKEKPQGVWVDLFLEKNVSLSCGLNIDFNEQDIQDRQNRNSGKSGLGATVLGGSVGLKFLFK